MASPAPSAISLLLFWTGALACAVAELAVLGAALRPADDAPAAAVSGRARIPVAEVIWALIPALALGLVFYWTWTAMHNPAAHGPRAGSSTPIHGVST